MIKRRFYRFEHGDRDEASASSSSSESEVDAEALSESDDDSVEQVEGDAEPCSTSSGFQSEDGSEDEATVESQGLLDNEADNETEDNEQIPTNRALLDMHPAQEQEKVSDQEPVPVDLPEFILKCKSVFKCRLCPKIVCLSEETLRAHLESKRHARSEKQFRKGHLKAMLNNDGEIENQDSSDVTPEQDLATPQDKPERKKKGRRVPRQQNRRFRKKRKEDD